MTAARAWIDVLTVQERLRCSRSKAYEHMRRALGRVGGRGQLRVPPEMWDRYERSLRGEIRAKRRSAPEPGVYFLHARTSGLVKIGFASHVRNRVRHIRALSPEVLDLLGVHYLEHASSADAREAFIHSQFSGLRVRGEWFTASDELVAYAREFGVPEWERQS